jgi:hypothetical protein
MKTPKLPEVPFQVYNCAVRQLGITMPRRPQVLPERLTNADSFAQWP